MIKVKVFLKVEDEVVEEIMEIDEDSMKTSKQQVRELLDSSPTGEHKEVISVVLLEDNEESTSSLEEAYIGYNEDAEEIYLDDNGLEEYWQQEDDEEERDAFMTEALYDFIDELLDEAEEVSVSEEEAQQDKSSN
ncbi:hypothetical protein D1872_50990 [compost metagenome]